MSECKKLFVLSAGALDKMTPGDKTPTWAVRESVKAWIEKATDEDIEKGFVDIPDGNGGVFTLVCRVVE